MDKIIKLSNRVKKLREECINTDPEICSERAVILTQAYQEYEDKQVNIKRALAISKVLDEMSVYILDGELIVGNHSRKIRAAPVFPEFDVQYIENELDLKLEGTPEHPILIINPNSEIMFKKLEDLTEEDYCCIDRNAFLFPNQNQDINFIQYCNKKDFSSIKLINIPKKIKEYYDLTKHLIVK